jgi:bifunctional non-homologous end joining protein LigD
MLYADLALPATESGVTLDVDGRPVTVTHPERVIFPELGRTKLDLVRYYVSVGPAVMGVLRDRPMLLKRYPRGASAEPFYQQHAPEGRPDWIATARTEFGGGGSAEQVVCNELGVVIWAVNLGCIELHPWAVRVPDVDNPDELRVDLDPGPNSSWDEIREVARVTRDTLLDAGLVSFPKTSGSRGIHIQIPIQPHWEFLQVRRAAIALAREVERRAPEIATAAWWKEERHGRIMLDYNQNARGRTTASAYSIRATPDARASTPLTWDDLAQVEPSEFTMATVPARLQSVGDPLARMAEHAGSLDVLLEWVERDEANGLGDAPWPPHFRKVAGEPIRAAPSRRKRAN